jgi:hypothetical protein
MTLNELARRSEARSGVLTAVEFLSPHDAIAMLRALAQEIENLVLDLKPKASQKPDPKLVKALTEAIEEEQKPVKSQLGVDEVKSLTQAEYDEEREKARKELDKETKTPEPVWYDPQKENILVPKLDCQNCFGMGCGKCLGSDNKTSADPKRELEDKVPLAQNRHHHRSAGSKSQRIRNFVETTQPVPEEQIITFMGGQNQRHLTMTLLSSLRRSGSLSRDPNLMYRSGR